MTFHERKFVAIVGLSQVGAIFASILACRIVLKIEGMGVHALRGSEFMARWGWWFLLVPVIWAVVVMGLAGSERRDSPGAYALIVLGLLVAGFFTVYAVAAILCPLGFQM